VIPFTFPGEPLFRLGPFVAARQGVDLAAQITLKSNAIVLAFMALVATMPFATAGHALHRLQVPDKIVHLLLMTYRYIFVLEQEYQRLVRAARIRGFQPGTNLHTYRTYAYLVGMLFVRAVDRAERVRWAMLCRGFKRKFYSLQEFKAGPGGVAFLLLISAALLTIAGLELR
jgi:cobalt/nickel transport system permease protein